MIDNLVTINDVRVFEKVRVCVSAGTIVFSP